MDAVTRREQFYAAMAGENVTPPEPVTREEQYLAAIAAAGGGGAMIVNLTQTSAWEGTIDKTNEEICEAFLAGKTVLFTGEIGGVDITIPVTTVVGTSYVAQGCAYVPETGDTMLISIKDLGRGNDVVGFIYAEIQTVEENYYVVDLTPTAQDYSGIMSQTPAEILEAYEQEGKRIIFRISALSAKIEATQFLIVGDSSIICVAGVYYTIDGVGDVLIKIQTDPSDSVYTTTIYPLTPMS